MDFNGDFSSFHSQNNAAAASNNNNGFGNLQGFSNQNTGVAASGYNNGFPVALNGNNHVFQNSPEAFNGYNNGKAAAVPNYNHGFHQSSVAVNGDCNNGSNAAAASNYDHVFRKSPEAFNGYNNGKAAAVSNYSHGFHQSLVALNGDNNNGSNATAASNYSQGFHQSSVTLKGDFNGYNATAASHCNDGFHQSPVAFNGDDNNGSNAAAISNYNQILNELPAAPNGGFSGHNNANNLSIDDYNDNTSTAVLVYNHVLDEVILFASDGDVDAHNKTLNATDVNTSVAASNYNQFSELQVASDGDLNDHNNTFTAADPNDNTSAAVLDDNHVLDEIQVASNEDFNGHNNTYNAADFNDHNNSNAMVAAADYNNVLNESSGGFNGDSGGNNSSELDNNLVIDDSSELAEMDIQDFKTWFENSEPKPPAAPSNVPPVSSAMNHTTGGQPSNQSDGFNGEVDGDNYSIGKTFHSDSIAGSSVFPTNPNQSGQPQKSSSSLSLPLHTNMSSIPASMASLSSQSNHPNLPNVTEIQLKGQNVDRLVSPSSVIPPPPQSLPKSGYLKIILECARISHSFADHAVSTLFVLDRIVSQVGDPSERLAFYFTQALYSWISKLPSPFRVRPTIGEKLEVYALLNRKCPFMKFAHRVANESLLRHANAEQVHIIDFGMVRATQWVYFLNNLPPRNPCKIRISGVVTSIFGSQDEGRLAAVGNHLRELAKSLGLNFEFNIILDPLESLNDITLRLFSNEMVIVNFTFELYRLLEKSESTVMKFLRMVKSLKPHLVTMAEYELGLNKVPFLQRVSNAMSFYSAVFESVEAGYGQDDPNRNELERVLLAPKIADVFGFDEGFGSVKRFEDKAGWSRLMKKSGFSLLPKKKFRLSRFTGKLRHELAACHPYYTVKETAPTFLSLAWKETELVTVSSWR